MATALQDEIWLSSDDDEETPITLLSPSKSPSTTTKPPLPIDLALDHVLLAVAHLHRCGGNIKARSAAFWPFCAGSVSDKERYDELVRGAGEKLSAERKGGGGRAVSVEEDLTGARRELREAEGWLKKGELRRDVDDLRDAVRESGIW